MDTQTPDQDVMSSFFDFIARNVFGLLCFISGLTYQIYQMTWSTKTMSRAQKLAGIALWTISGFTVVVMLSNIDINKLLYGFICWATPITIKPLAEKWAEKSPQLCEVLVGWIISYFDRKKKNNE